MVEIAIVGFDSGGGLAGGGAASFSSFPKAHSGHRVLASSFGVTFAAHADDYGHTYAHTHTHTRAHAHTHTHTHKHSHHVLGNVLCLGRRWRNTAAVAVLIACVAAAPWYACGRGRTCTIACHAASAELHFS